MDIYQLLQPLLFSIFNNDPESIQKQSLNLLYTLDSTPRSPITKLVKASFQQSFCRTDKKLSQSLFGINFSNPVGLAAGFDKNGIAAGMWQYLGFGFAELGTVTYHPQDGNSRPRLFRLPKDRAALNNMGLNNLGSVAMMTALKQKQYESFGMPIGISLSKSKIVSPEDAAADYLSSFQTLQDFGDYFVINISCPNVPNLQDIKNLQIIFDTLQQCNQGKKPILVKISPDLDWEGIIKIIELSQAYQLAGIIATNTTRNLDNLTTEIVTATGKKITETDGSISGIPLRQKSTEVIRFIYQQTEGKLPIIGVGGIFTAEAAWEKITAGASLIQV
jgi:dihydroorotate dehydrogenase